MFPTRSARRWGLISAVLWAALGAGAARAQMTPVHDYRLLMARAEYQQVTDGPYWGNPPVPFAPWQDTRSAIAYGDLAGSSSADATQASAFFPAMIYASGAVSGGWDIPDGYYSADSEAYFTFSVSQCVEYSLEWWLTESDPATGSAAEIELRVGSAALDYQAFTTAGHDSTRGRLSPGTYYVGGRGHLSTRIEYPPSPTYSYFFRVLPVGAPLIAQSPSSQEVSAGSGVTMQVIPTGVAAAPAAATSGQATTTFQWRRNFVPLVNDGQLSGVTTPLLTITAAAVPDSGWYDVVLTQGAVEEPSSPAHLTVNSAAGVHLPQGPGSAFTLGPASPNPSADMSTFRFASARPGGLSAEVFDAAGRRIRSLSVTAGASEGTLSWDGRDEAGARVRTGLYFLRASSGGDVRHCRVVRVE